MDYDALQLKVFKRVPDEEVQRIVREAASEIGKLLERAIAYDVERAFITSYGDYLFRVKIGDEVVGALTVTTINNEVAIVRGRLGANPRHNRQKQGTA